MTARDPSPRARRLILGGGALACLAWVGLILWSVGRFDVPPLPDRTPSADEAAQCADFYPPIEPHEENPDVND